MIKTEKTIELYRLLRWIKLFIPYFTENLMLREVLHNKILLNRLRLYWNVTLNLYVYSDTFWKSLP